MFTLTLHDYDYHPMSLCFTSNDFNFQCFKVIFLGCLQEIIVLVVALLDNGLLTIKIS